MLASNPLEPLVLADGRKIDPATGKVINESRPKFVEVPTKHEAQELVIKTRKTVAELPLPPKQMSSVGLVAFYTLFGLPDAEIAIAVGASVAQIQQVKGLDIYREFMQQARANILEAEQEDVRAIFQEQAISAARKIVEHVHSDNDVLSFKASQDILDRAGHRPNDVVEHRVKLEDALQIVVIEPSKEQVPTIDADYVDLDKA